MTRRVSSLLRTAPVTAVLAGVVWGLGLFAADLSGALVVTALLAACGLAERRLGPWRMLAVFAAAQVLASAIPSTVVLAGRPDWFWPGALGHGRALGLEPGLFGVVAAATSAMGALWRRRARVSLLAYLAMMAMYSGGLSDLRSLAGALAGLALGRLIASRPAPAATAPLAWPGQRESRILVTALLLASGIGPVVASLHVRATRPMAHASQLLVTSVPAPTAVRTICGQAGHEALCRVLRANLHAPGPSALLLAALPVLLTIGFADGLRRGRRAAWWGALATQLGSAAVVLVDLFGATDPGQLAAPAALLLAPPTGLAIVLVATRRVFAVRAAAGTYRRALAIAALLLGGALAAHIAIVTTMSEQFVPRGSAATAVEDFFARLAPTPLVARPSTVPSAPLAGALAGATAPVFWLLLLGVLVRTFWRSAGADVVPAAQSAARGILREHGDGSLSYQTMWPGQSYWFTDDGSTYVAYRVVGSVALTTAGPVGPAHAVPGALAGFAVFCDRRAWIPCLYGVTEDLAGQCAPLGWRRLHVGDEAVLDLRALAFRGRRWQDIRTARNKAERANVRPVWCALRHVGPDVLGQVREMSQEWLATKGLPEMGFTLGGLDEALDDDVRCLLAIDEGNRVHAMTSWLPVHRAGRVLGWTLDLMRRRRDSLPGVMEFLIATAAEQFRTEGIAELSLSGTPFTVTTGGRPRADTRLMVGAARILEPVYGFRSLLTFKDKFQPAYRPLFLTYPDPTALPAIGNAVGRAYLPALTLRQTARMLAIALR